MEFLRFGSSIPGIYWGCCACDIIQNFKFDPDAKASMQVVSGDSNTALSKGKEMLFTGPTYRDIFRQRIRISTFDSRDQPNHGFLAILTKNQIKGVIGKKWLAILKEEGFEFIRTISNSVYGGTSLLNTAQTRPEAEQYQNYLFGLFRNIGSGAVVDPRQPPEEWSSLPDPYNGDMSSEGMFNVQLLHWNNTGPTRLMTESEIVSAEAPVMLSGIRDGHRPEEKSKRQERLALAKAKTGSPTSAFPTTQTVLDGMANVLETMSENIEDESDEDDDYPLEYIEDCDCPDCEHAKANGGTLAA